jgi:hypothetical protein
MSKVRQRSAVTGRLVHVRCSMFGVGCLLSALMVDSLVVDVEQTPFAR